MTKDNNYMDVMSKDAQRVAFGLPAEQCHVCGEKAPLVHATSKEAVFQNDYGLHYSCAKHANTPEYLQFEKDWTPLSDVAQKKKAQQALFERQQADLKKKEEEDAKAIPAESAPEAIPEPAPESSEDKAE